MHKESRLEINRYGNKSIGIVGGVGPFAGIDLMTKILTQTHIQSEQDHLPITLLSYSNKIPDRTEYLLGLVDENPADELFKVIQSMSKIGVSVAAIACNTAHVSEIFNVIKDRLIESKDHIKLLHIVNAVINYLKDCFPQFKKVGVLSTSGSYTFQLYETYIKSAGLKAIRVPEDMQKKLVHSSIYHSDYGIKVTSPKIKQPAEKNLRMAAEILIEKGAEAIILGCTEIPLALTERKINDTVLIDPNWVLARALITEFDSKKLRQS